MKVTPPRRRSTLRHTAGGLELVIPAKRNVFSIFLIVFLAAWLGGWFIGEASALRELFHFEGREPNFFLMFWLLGWTAGGVFALYALLWLAVGREVVSLRSGSLTIKRAVLGVGLTREYDLAHIKDLRVSPQPANQFGWNMSPWGMGGGLVAFDYGAKTVRFAASVEESEASQIVSDLKALHTFQ
jgi:hypothetical protein